MSKKNKIAYIILFTLAIWWLIAAMTSCKTVAKNKDGFYKVKKFGKFVVTDDSSINLRKQ